MIQKAKAPFLIMGLSLILAACASAVSGSTQPASRDSQAATVGSNPTAPDIEIELYQGSESLGSETVLLSEILDDGKPVVLNFWAGLCPPCRLEMPDFQRSYEDHREEITLIGVDVGPFTNLGTRADGRELLRELGVSYPAGTTSDAEVVVKYRVLGMPSTFFISPDGQIVETWSGLLTEEKLAELIDNLLAVSG
jgi:thiol-disulfide isomerase/thioredoxin